MVTFRYLFDRLRAHYFPNEFHRMVARWNADDPCDLRRFDFPLNKQSVALDLGGFKGEWTSHLYARYGCQIYTFEPVVAYVECLRRRYEPNPDIHVFDFGLGGSTHSEKLTICGDRSSAFRRESGSLQEIRIVDAIEWLEAANIPAVDLMKINIEGGEFELLERLIQGGWISRVRHLLVQFHDVFPDAAARMEAIHQNLHETHAPAFQYRFVWEHWVKTEV